MLFLQRDSQFFPPGYSFLVGLTRVLLEIAAISCHHLNLSRFRALNLAALAWAFGVLMFPEQRVLVGARPSGKHHQVGEVKFRFKRGKHQMKIKIYWIYAMNVDEIRKGYQLETLMAAWWCKCMTIPKSCWKRLRWLKFCLMPSLDIWIFSMLLGVSEPNDVNSFPPVRLTSPFPLHQAQI